MKLFFTEKIRTNFVFIWGSHTHINYNSRKITSKSDTLICEMKKKNCYFYDGKKHLKISKWKYHKQNNYLPSFNQLQDKYISKLPCKSLRGWKRSNFWSDTFWMRTSYLDLLHIYFFITEIKAKSAKMTRLLKEMRIAQLSS